MKKEIKRLRKAKARRAMLAIAQAKEKEIAEARAWKPTAYFFEYHGEDPFSGDLLETHFITPWGKFPL